LKQFFAGLWKVIFDDDMELLGVGQKDFKDDEEGLKIAFTEKKPGYHTYAFKFSGNDIV
jgi:hypothetical protein